MVDKVKRLRANIFSRAKKTMDKYKKLAEEKKKKDEIEEHQKKIKKEMDKAESKRLLDADLDEVDKMSLEEKIKRDNAKAARRKALRDLMLKD